TRNKERSILNSYSCTTGLASRCPFSESGIQSTGTSGSQLSYTIRWQNMSTWRKLLELFNNQPPFFDFQCTRSVRFFSVQNSEHETRTEISVRCQCLASHLCAKEHDSSMRRRRTIPQPGPTGAQRARLT